MSLIRRTFYDAIPRLAVVAIISILGFEIIDAMIPVDGHSVLQIIPLSWWIGAVLLIVAIFFVASFYKQATRY